MTSLGYGDGSGYGSGFGDGYGDCSGYDGFGSGYGEGYGLGYAFGAGEGYGHGLGYGCGSGYSYGAGYGCGDSVLVATIGEHEVRAVITPWGRTVRVGCQVHGLDTWRERWRAIAQEHGVTVTSEEVARLIALVEEVPMGPEWLPSEERGARDRGVAGA